MFKVGIFYGFDEDKDAKKYCLELEKKYGRSEDFAFLDLSNFKNKEDKIRILSGFTKVSFGIHSCEYYYPINIELEFCKNSDVSYLASYLKQQKLVDNLVALPYEFWDLTGYPQNFAILEIFRNKDSFSRLEQLLLETVIFFKSSSV